MSNEQQPTAIPEDFQDWLAEESHKVPTSAFWNDARAYNSGVLDGGEKAYRYLSAEIAVLKAERDVYRKALQEVYSEGMFGYINGDVAGTLAKMAKKALDQYPSASPKIDK